MKQGKWEILRLIAMLMVLVFLYSFAKHRSENRKISAVKVEFQGYTKMFLTYEMVNNLLIQNLKHTSNIQKDDIDLIDLENKLEKHPLIENAEVYISTDGQLITKIKQKTPIARVVNTNRNFYMDKRGDIFETSNVYSARVPLISGEMSKEYKSGYVHTLKTIAKDNFLRKNIIAVKITNDGGMKMLTRDYDYELIFGKPILIERKFKNYKAFYQFAQRDSLLPKYKSINLMFTQQVVCAK